MAFTNKNKPYLTAHISTLFPIGTAITHEKKIQIAIRFIDQAK